MREGKQQEAGGSCTGQRAQRIRDAARGGVRVSTMQLPSHRQVAGVQKDASSWKSVPGPSLGTCFRSGALAVTRDAQRWAEGSRSGSEERHPHAGQMPAEIKSCLTRWVLATGTHPSSGVTWEWRENRTSPAIGWSSKQQQQNKTFQAGV